MVAGFQDDVDSEDETLTQGKAPSISIQQNIDISSDEDQPGSSMIQSSSVTTKRQHDKKPKLPKPFEFESPITLTFDAKRTSSQSKQNSLDTTPKTSARGDQEKATKLGKIEAIPGKVVPPVKTPKKDESTESSEDEDLPKNVVVMNDEEDVEEEDSGNGAKNSSGVASVDDAETAKPMLYTLNLDDLDALERNYSGSGM